MWIAEADAVYFLSDARRHKDDEIKRNPNVNLSFADASDQKYVSVSGTAAVSNDRAKIKELFTTSAKAWWDSAEDPNIRVLKFTPERCRVLGLAGHCDQLCEDGRCGCDWYASRHRHQP